MSEGRIHSDKVIMIEGDAGKFVHKEKSAAGRHGFVVLVPPGDAGERFLDLVWRFTMLYAAMPVWLSRRAKVAKMIEAVMGKTSREQKPAHPPANKSGPANRTQRNRSVLPSPYVVQSSARKSKSKGTAEGAKSQPGPAVRRGAKARKKN